VTPLFDKSAELVGWISDSFEHVFDTDMGWVGFIRNNHVWRASDGEWVGPMVDGNIYAGKGHPIAWSNRNISGQAVGFKPYKPYKPFKPFKPYKPFKPFKPFKPYVPAGGWSRTPLRVCSIEFLVDFELPLDCGAQH
jgi:hypothetical protein